jgi:gluconate 5-dehydrogenase
MHVKELFDLSDRVAIVTGASSGLGVWFARGLAEAGAHVVLAARRFERLQAVANELQEIGVRTLAVQTDVTQEAHVRQLVDATVAEFGRIDILVNNAGGGGPETSVETMAMADVRQRFELNLFGLWHCCQRVGRVMLERGEGRIINVSSLLGLSAGQIEPAPAYCSAKSAVIGVTRDLAFEWAERGVRVHCVAPGIFPTEGTAEDLANPELKEVALRAIPLGRFGGEDDIKGLVTFLASPAGDFAIGHPILFGGGQLLGAF